MKKANLMVDVNKGEAFFSSHTMAISSESNTEAPEQTNTINIVVQDAVEIPVNYTKIIKVRTEATTQGQGLSYGMVKGFKADRKIFTIPRTAFQLYDGKSEIDITNKTKSVLKLDKGQPIGQFVLADSLILAIFPQVKKIGRPGLITSLIWIWSWLSSIILVPLSYSRIKINRLATFCKTPVNHQQTVNKCDGKLESSTAGEELLEIEGGQVKISAKLDCDEKQILASLLNTFQDIFSHDGTKLGYCTLYEHVIETGKNPPIHLNLRRYSDNERQEMQRQVDQMLKLGVIRPSRSPYAAPIVLVPKPGENKWRCTIDYRKLNAISVKDHYPMPNIQDALRAVRGCHFFTALDLNAGFWQIGVRKEDIPKTAFITPDGLFEFLRMPFGLACAPATFQRTMDIVLASLKWNTAVAYMDDVLIFSKDYGLHIGAIKSVLSRLREAGLTINPSKCSFFKTNLTYLGHVITKDGIKTNPDTIRSVVEFPRPKNLQAVQSFVSLAGYYRRFVADFARIAQPLAKLSRKTEGYSWTSEQEEAFEKLKTILTTDPVLAHFDRNKETELRTDACGYGIGGALVQKYDQGFRPVAYFSRLLNTAEKNYCISQQEALAVVDGVERYRCYLSDVKFTIVTDHCALCFIMTKKDLSRRLTLWSLVLQGFDFDIIYKSGKVHKDADCLSRFPVDQPALGQYDKHMIPVFNVFSETTLLQRNQKADRELNLLMQYLKSPKDMPIRMVKKASRFTLKKGAVYKKDGQSMLPVIPKAMREDILFLFHDDPLNGGHLGYKKTLVKVRSKVYFKGMSRYVKKYVASCLDCQTKKVPKVAKVGYLQPPRVGQIFDCVGIDILGPFPQSQQGNKYIVVATEYLTRMAMAHPYPDATSESVADFILKQIIVQHGCPKRILSDRGTQFISKATRELYALLKIQGILCSGYNPATNGLTERMNATLATMVSMYVSSSHRDWDLYIQMLVFAYNTSQHASTGFSPFFLLYGRESNTPVDVLFDVSDELVSPHSHVTVLHDHFKRIHTIARKRLTETQTKAKRLFDAKHTNLEFSIGDKVFLYTPRKLSGRAEKLLHNYYGPYVIVEKYSPLVYGLEVVRKTKTGKRKQRIEVAHISRLKIYNERDSFTTAPPTDSETEFYEPVITQEAAEIQLEGNVNVLPTSVEPFILLETEDQQKTSSNSASQASIMAPAQLSSERNIINGDAGNTSALTETYSLSDSQTPDTEEAPAPFEVGTRETCKRPTVPGICVPRRSKRLAEASQEANDGLRRSKRARRTPVRLNVVQMVTPLFLIMLLKESNAAFDRMAPILWRNLNIPVISKLEEMTLYVKYESPCMMFENSTMIEDRAQPEFTSWCERVYDQDFIQPLTKMCPKSMSLNREKQISRHNKRGVIMASVAAIGSIVAVAVGAYSILGMHQAELSNHATKINELINRLDCRIVA